MHTQLDTPPRRASTLLPPRCCCLQVCKNEHTTLLAAMVLPLKTLRLGGELGIDEVPVPQVGVPGLMIGASLILSSVRMAYYSCLLGCKPCNPVELTLLVLNCAQDVEMVLRTRYGPDWRQDKVRYCNWQAHEQPGCWGASGHGHGWVAAGCNAYRTVACNTHTHTATPPLNTPLTVRVQGLGFDGEQQAHMEAAAGAGPRRAARVMQWLCFS